MFPADFVGTTAAFVSLTSLIAMLALLGLDYAMIRFLPHASKPDVIINSSFPISAVMAVLACVVFLLGIRFWSPALALIGEHWFLGIAFCHSRSSDDPVRNVGGCLHCTKACGHGCRASWGVRRNKGVCRRNAFAHFP
jgi:hypothetical protein